MKRIILCLSLFVFFGSQAQQINPVPDYVFSNKMSVGRNAVTDTAAYFSIGPRYGAIRGMMPPMVTDTASMSATKRNGLLIFSIQKNKYLYWDSVGSKWAEMAGTAGSAITGSGVAGYMPEFTTATNIDTTRLYHSNGRFAIGSTTTTNGVFNVYGGQSYFDTSLKVGSQTLLADEGKNEVYVNTTTDNGAYSLQVAGSIYNTTGAVLAASSGNVGIGTTTPNSLYSVEAVKNGDVIYNSRTTSTTGIPYSRYQNTTTNILSVGIYAETGASAPFVNDGAFQYTNGGGGMQIITANITPIQLFTNNTERVRIFGNGRVFIGSSPSDAGYQLDINGTARVQGGNATASALFTSTPTIGGIDVANTGTLANTRISQIRLINGTTTLGANDRTYQLINIGESATASAFALQYWNGSANTELLRINSSGEFLYNTAIDAGAYALQVAGAIYNTTTITTGAPTSGSAKPWRLGEADTVSPTSPNRTIRVEIDGTVYYIHAKTTND